MFEIAKQIIRMKNHPSTKDMYYLREIMRTLLAKQPLPGKEERIFLDRVFANLRFLGDAFMLRACLVGEFSHEVDTLAGRYMNKPINDDGMLFTRREYEDVRVGNCISIYLLGRCILHNNPSLLIDMPDWVSDEQLTTHFVDRTIASPLRGFKALKHLSAMVYRMPLSIDIDEEERKFLYLLLSRLYLLASPHGLRREVVKKVDFNGLSKRYVKVLPDNMWCFRESDIILGKLGQSEALLKLAWQIVRDNHQRIFHKESRLP